MQKEDVAVRVRADQIAGRNLRYYDLVLAAFCVILVLSNVVGAAKVATLGGLTFGAGILFFPLSYVIGDVLTEVYGYARARRVIWAGFASVLFAALMCWVIVIMPPAPGWEGQEVYEAAFGQVWRIVGASMLAFWAGEFVNSYVLARMKLWTAGKHLWSRTIGSTIIGQAFDSLIFYPLAFYGIWSTEQILTVMTFNWALKVGWEVVLTPLTYLVVNFMKRREGLDVFDEDTKFTPFRTKV